MNETWHDLRQVFIDDHTKITRGYRAIVKALRQGNEAEAAQIADELDLVAGPHIEFEERWLYPRVGQVRGSDYTDRLYHEHDEMVDGLRTLRRLRESSESLPDPVRAKLVHQMETGLEHATTCGTLLSHLATRPITEQRALFEAIQQLRANPKRWTDLDVAPSQPPSSTGQSA